MKLKEWFTCSDARDALYKGGATLLWLLSVLVIIIVASVILVLSRGGLSTGYYENTITVSGEAEIFAVPDTASINFTVNEEADELSDAQESVTMSMNTILDALYEEGIDEEDIKTQNYSSNPRYEYNRKTGERVLAGYNVQHSVLVKVRDIDTVGGVVALLGSYDIDNMYGPNFTIDDPEQLQQDARAEAIEDAREEAKRLAKELDVRLGKLISFDEGGYAPFMMKADMGGAMVAMDSAFEEEMVVPDIPTGEQSITANVTLTYKIK